MVKEAVRAIMKRTLTKETAILFNMQGKRDKKPFTKLLLHKLIIGSFFILRGTYKFFLQYIILGPTIFLRYALQINFMFSTICTLY